MVRKQIGVAARFGLGFLLIAASLIGSSVILAQYPLQSQISKDGTAVLLEDYASLPLSSPIHAGMNPATIDYKNQLGRVTSLRSEPGNSPLAASRVFVDDQSGTLYILDRATRKFTPYIKFLDVFPRFESDTANSAGIVSFAFDPRYSKNGKFYTVHVEKVDLSASAAPTNVLMPGLNLNGYAITPSVNAPASAIHFESVLIEWTDTNIRNSTFEGTAREVLRIGIDRGMSLCDLQFNPAVQPGHEDYGNLYISVGDGFYGENPGPEYTVPQHLNTLLGKVLRITPDINLRPKDILSSNGRYRIPSTGSDPNPFVSVAEARGEIYAYGFRNPHRMAWDAVTKTLLADDLGIRSWEEVNVVLKGKNYGYPAREGNEVVFVGGPNSAKTAGQINPPPPPPDNDLLTVPGIPEPMIPVYPAAVYSHQDGDAIGSGIVYRGKLMPQLRGKYIFADHTTGRVFYADLAEMLAAKGQRNHQAQIHELQIMYSDPKDASKSGPVKRRMFDIVADAYLRKDGAPGQDHVLPGFGPATTGWRDPEHRQPKTDPEGVAYGGGRADLRIAADGDGEIYVLSKSDGMIRKLTAIVGRTSASK